MIVYTCITNQKDQLQPVSREPGVRFICFSDREFVHPVWEWVQTKSRGLGDHRRVARRYKILAHRYFGDQTTIWIDGRVQLRKPVAHYLDKYKGLVCARRHHDRRCVYAEGAQIKKINYDHPEIIDTQIEALRSIGYPENNGLHETGMLLRRKGAQEFNERWWAWVSCHSKRDQMSFDIVAWQMGLNITDIDRGEVQVLKHKKQTNVTF